MRVCMRVRTLERAKSRTLPPATAAGRPLARAAAASPREQTHAFAQSLRRRHLSPAVANFRGYQKTARGHRSVRQVSALPRTGRSSVGVVTHRYIFFFPGWIESKVGRARPTSSPTIDEAESSSLPIARNAWPKSRAHRSRERSFLSPSACSLPPFRRL